MKRILTLLSILSAFTFANDIRHLDKSFGENKDGVVHYTVQDVPAGSYGTFIEAIVEQEDKKFLILQETHYASEGNPSGTVVPTLTRHHSDGRIDTSFGNGSGQIQTLERSGMIQRELLVDTDQKALVIDMTNGVRIQRYNSDGATDFSFANNGVLEDNNIDINGSYFKQAQIYPDSKILVSSLEVDFDANGTTSKSHLIRYNSDGSRDTTFGINGQVKLIGFSNFRLQNDGSIMVITSTYSAEGFQNKLIKLTQSGSLDSTFGDGDGQVLLEYNANDLTVNSRFDDQGDFISPVATASAGGTFSVGLRRWKNDGSEDLSFGVNGEAFVAEMTYPFLPDDFLTIQHDGKIVTYDFEYDETVENLVAFKIHRFNANGTVDESFGTGDGVGGVMRIVNASPTLLVYPKLQVLNDGKIIVGDGSESETFSLYRFNPTLGSSATAPVLMYLLN